MRLKLSYIIMPLSSAGHCEGAPLAYATVAISTLRTGEKTLFDTFPEGNKKVFKVFWVENRGGLVHLLK